MDRPRLLFVSPRFLLPADSGGKIRTSQILRHLKGGAYRVELISPAPDNWSATFQADVAQLADAFYPSLSRPPWLQKLRTYTFLLSTLPASVRADRSKSLASAIGKELATSPDVAIFDFPHSAVNLFEPLSCPSVLFTHNVEAEIYQRHWQISDSPVKRRVWRSQFDKMLAYERQTLQRFDTVIAVSDRDAIVFRKEHRHSIVRTIDTGVDLDFFRFCPPGEEKELVFLGSMDWPANIEAVEFFMDEVWPTVVQVIPDVTMTIVGRAPPKSLVNKARGRGLPWHFTDFVEDVRPWVSGKSAMVIPLRVGGGTRIKAYEAIAMGCPVVSTSVGVEGLAVTPGEHYLLADDPQDFALATIKLLRERSFAVSLAERARAHVARNYGWPAIARQFEQICAETIERSRANC